MPGHWIATHTDITIRHQVTKCKWLARASSKACGPDGFRTQELAFSFLTNTTATLWQHGGIQAGGIRWWSAQHHSRHPECVEFSLADRESMYAPLRDPCNALWEIMAECSEVSGGGWRRCALATQVFCWVLKDRCLLIRSPHPATLPTVFMLLSSWEQTWQHVMVWENKSLDSIKLVIKG